MDLYVHDLDEVEREIFIDLASFPSQCLGAMRISPSLLENALSGSNHRGVSTAGSWYGDTAFEHERASDNLGDWGICTQYCFRTYLFCNFPQHNYYSFNLFRLTVSVALYVRSHSTQRIKPKCSTNCNFVYPWCNVITNSKISQMSHANACCVRQTIHVMEHSSWAHLQWDCIWLVSSTRVFFISAKLFSSVSKRFSEILQIF